MAAAPAHQLAPIFPLPRPDLLDMEDSNDCGSGHFATVCFCVYNNKEVAVKQPKPAPEDGTHDVRKAAAALRREAEMLTRLRDLEIPQLLRFYGCVFEDDDDAQNVQLMVMEKALCSLQDRLERHPDTALQVRLHWLLCVARALQVVHEHGIVHNDLATRNVFLCDDEDARLGDWGLACKQHAPGVDGVLPLPQCAPETITERVMTARTDVFQFGSLMYETLTGRAPFADVDAQEAGRRIVAGERATFDDVSKQQCPDEARELIRQCWEHVPGRRPSMSFVKDALEELLRADQYGELTPEDLGRTLVASELLHVMEAVDAEELDTPRVHGLADVCYPEGATQEDFSCAYASTWCTTTTMKPRLRMPEPPLLLGDEQRDITVFDAFHPVILAAHRGVSGGDESLGDFDVVTNRRALLYVAGSVGHHRCRRLWAYRDAHGTLFMHRVGSRPEQHQNRGRFIDELKRECVTGNKMGATRAVVEHRAGAGAGGAAVRMLVVAAIDACNDADEGDQVLVNITTETPPDDTVHGKKRKSRRRYIKQKRKAKAFPQCYWGACKQLLIGQREGSILKGVDELTDEQFFRGECNLKGDEDALKNANPVLLAWRLVRWVHEHTQQHGLYKVKMDKRKGDEPGWMCSIERYDEDMPVDPSPVSRAVEDYHVWKEDQE